MRRIVLHLLLSLWLPQCLLAQKTTSEILASVGEDPGLLAWQRLAERYRTSPITLPLLEEVQLRGRSRRFATMRHDVILRTSFNSPGERTAERDKHHALTGMKSLQGKEHLQTLLQKRFGSLLEAIHLDKQLEFAEARLIHHQTMDTLYLLGLAAGQSTDLSRFLKNKEDIIQSGLELENLRAKRNRQYAFLDLGQEDSIITRDLVTPPTMHALVESLLPQYELTLEAQDNETRLRYLSASKAAQSARDHRILDFLEGRYTIRNDLFFEDRFTIGLGLTAPWRGSSKIKMQKLILDQEELKTNQEVSQWRFQEEFDREKSHFLHQFALLQAYDEAMSDSTLQALRETISRSGRASAWEIEQLRFALQEVKARQWGHYHRLVSSFLQLMDLSEGLYQEPLRDYLHDYLPLIR